MRSTLVAALVAALSTTVISPLFAEVANDEQTLALAARVDNNGFDRATLMVGNQIQFWQPVFDTLITQNAENELLPNLATAWSYNEDATALTLTLRAGVTFTDGAPFNAAAVQANLEYLAKGNGQNGYMARSIASYDILSDTEIRLNLAVPDPALLVNLALVGGAMASPASLGTKESEQLPVGSGPYLYSADESTPGSQYVYRRNPDYWNSKDYPFESVTIAPITDTVARINAMVAGQVDGTVANTRAVTQAEATGLQVHQGDVNYAGIVIADRGGSVVPALGDKRVRQAFNMAFDKAAILKFIDLGYGKVTDQIFPDTSEAYDPALDTYYSYDPEGARALLAEAGYPDGFEVTFPNIQPFAAFNPVITQQLAEIGVKVTFEATAPGTAIPTIRAGKYPAFFFTFGARDAWTDIQQHLTPDAGWNGFKHSDPEMNALIEAAQYATGEAQIEAFREVNRYLVEAAYYVPLYRQYTIYLTGADTDVDMQPGNAVPFIRNYRPKM